MKKSILRVLRWFFCVFCFFGMITYGVLPGTIILFLVGVCSLPLTAINTVWEKIYKVLEDNNEKLKKYDLSKIKVVLLGILFFTAIMLLPLTDKNSEEISKNKVVSNLDNTNEQLISDAGTNTVSNDVDSNTLNNDDSNSSVDSDTEKQEKLEIDVEANEGIANVEDVVDEDDIETDINTEESDADVIVLPPSNIEEDVESEFASTELVEEKEDVEAVEEIINTWNTVVPALSAPIINLSNIPPYSGNPYFVVNGNEPYFSDLELTVTSFELYSELDSLGRCGVVYASIGTDIMPTEERDSIGSVKPTGWHTVKYDNVDGKYLYNRCHLLGYQLTGENANVKNLITGTRYLNVDGMLPFENMIADYVVESENHVQYRVTPVFEGNNLVASGVLLEAKSVEDEGESICFNVYCYNVQPDIIIDYATGDSNFKTVENIEQSGDMSS